MFNNIQNSSHWVRKTKLAPAPLQQFMGGDEGIPTLASSCRNTVDTSPDTACKVMIKKLTAPWQKAKARLTFRGTTEWLPCKLYPQDPEEETQEQVSKDKVTVLASSKSRNGNNTEQHWWAKMMEKKKIKRCKLVEYKVEKLWNIVFREWHRYYKVI